MSISTTLVNVPLGGNTPSRAKDSHRPPALVLEDYNQPLPEKPDVPEGSVSVKTKQGFGVLQRLQDRLLPSSRTPISASEEAPVSSDVPSQPKQKQPRSASLPSVRWDMSPLGKKSARPSQVKAATTDGIPLSAVSSTASNHYKVKGMKVRVITWNMHDSLPKGELEELLGNVPPYAPNPASPPGTFPILPEEPDHPYHFVVVAGQECPSLSGLPMALGAGFKLKDRDKDKEKEKEKDKEKEKETGGSLDKDSERASSPQLKAKEGTKESRNSETFLVKPTVTKKGNAPNLDDNPRTPSPEALQINIPNNPPAGWSSVVEDWLCNGGIFELPKAPKTPKIVEVVGNVVTAAVPGTPRLALKRAPSFKEPKKGPYQLLVKERLMGIYLAIYVHRDLKPLIKGTSKSAVTAGLIGGRVGNKGGVGISVNVDGTTLLFLNAHLAAHEGRVNHRLANLAKIKSELEVDDFLPKGDPRKSCEDLTDRFDFTFLCGDLNFRLDITRLHADWLISRKEYAQALAFDQLRKVMKENAPEFKGFNEADIDFAPTFKYDVLRTLKRRKRADDDDDDLDPDAEAMSISSFSTTYSRATDGEANATTQVSPVASVSKTSLSLTPTVQKAKQKLLSLKSPFGVGSPRSGKKQAGTADNNGFALPDLPMTPPGSGVTHFPPTPKAGTPVTAVLLTPSGNVSVPSLVPPPRLKVESMKSGVTSSQENLDAEKGVYDTSHKKRVPSWCDRILWKTTIEPSLSPEPSPDLRHQQLLSPPPKKVSGFRGLFRAKSAKIPRRPPTLAVPSPGPSPEFLPPLKTAPPLTQTIFVTAPEEKGEANGAVSASATQGRFQRRVSASSPPPTAPAERQQKRSTGFGVLISPLSGGESGTPSRWRFLPNFLSPSSHSAEPTIEEPVTPLVTPAIVRRRGEVVCLDYNTLDDKRMRRLEGRSDHRPVLGTFVMYM